MVRSDHVTTRSGVELRVLFHEGADSLVPMLLVHGLSSNAHLWDGVASELSRSGHPVAAVDQRGHGQSDRPDHGYDFATLSEDLVDVIEAHFLRPAVVVGQSWGGNVVLELAARHPEWVRAVVCVDGGFIRLSDRFADWDAARLALTPPRFEGLTRASLEAGARARYPGWPETGIRGQSANFEELADGTIRQRLALDNHMAILAELFRHDPDLVAEGLRVPVLVIAVDEVDAAKRHRVETFARRLRSGRVVWMDAHHDVHAQHPVEVARLIGEMAQ